MNHKKKCVHMAYDIYLKVYFNACIHIRQQQLPKQKDFQTYHQLEKKYSKIHPKYPSGELNMAMENPHFQ